MEFSFQFLLMYSIFYYNLEVSPIIKQECIFLKLGRDEFLTLERIEKTYFSTLNIMILQFIQ